MITSIILLAGLLTQVPQSDEVRLVNNLLAAKTDKCWTLDRLSRKDIVSCAATGVGFYAYARASQLHIISREEASAWIRRGFDEMLIVNSRNLGWLYHFVDLKGKPYKDSEVSTIDTVIFYCGAERAAQLLNDQPLLNHIRDLKKAINKASMTDSDGYFYHGWEVELGEPKRVLKSRWKHYNEGVLIYKYFDIPFKPTHIQYDLPLFVYFYPLAFYPNDHQWQEHLGKAIDYQLEETGRFGYSAQDGINGYVVNSPYCVSPVGVYSCMRFFPSKCQEQLKQFKVDRLIQSVSINGKWVSQDRVLQDDGFLLMLLGDNK